MKRYLIYSCIFHIIFFLFIVFLQEQFKSEEIVSKPVLVTIIPLQPLQPQLKQPLKPPKTIEKMPPLKETRRPKYLSAIPKGNRGYEKNEKTENLAKNLPSESLKQEKEFKELKSFRQNPDIFDKDVIAKLSKKSGKTKSEEIETSHGLSFSAKEFNDWGYLERLKEKIERVWQYPPQAAQRGIYGDLYIRFTIDKKGKLVSIELLRTSGYRMLDDAAIQALKDAQPFWPLPDDYGKDSLTITGHFIYTLRGFYLR